VQKQKEIHFKEIYHVLTFSISEMFFGNFGLGMKIRTFSKLTWTEQLREAFMRKKRK
jgi:hypothetical protein